MGLVATFVQASGRVSYKGGVLVEAGLGELFEALGEVARQRRGRRLGDEEEHPHGVHFRIGRFPLGQLDGRDAQRPNVRLVGVQNHTINKGLTKMDLGEGGSDIWQKR